MENIPKVTGFDNEELQKIHEGRSVLENLYLFKDIFETHEKKLSELKERMHELLEKTLDTQNKTELASIDKELGTIVDGIQKIEPLVARLKTIETNDDMKKYSAMN